MPTRPATPVVPATVLDLAPGSTRLAGAQDVFHARVDAPAWRAAAQRLHDAGATLVALWALEREPGTGGRDAVQAVWALPEGALWLDLALDESGQYPSIADLFSCAGRMQRAAADLSGVRATGPGSDPRPWLRHAAWPAGVAPLRLRDAPADPLPATDAPYEFVRVEGEGVHEIGVGPVHAGIIEPGHFRFSVVGEKVLRLEERLGYVHKGIEHLWRGMDPAGGLALAQRVSGDSLFAYGWAWCLALEALAGSTPPLRAQWLRAFALERERVANHLGDLGALGNDAAFAFGLTQFSRLKEDWLRRNAELFGHRYARDFLVPGGVRADIEAPLLAQVRADTFALEAEVRVLRTIYSEHAGLQDRFRGTGRVDAALARRLGLTGLAARASGTGRDLRATQPGPVYAALDFTPALREGGDVAARVEVRFDEVLESLRLLRRIADGIPSGPVRSDCGPVPAAARALGRVEGWRGEVLVAIETGPDARILRAHAHDPSWQNWPVLEHAVIGNIVPDFPLINKSFNLSYSGHDL